MKILKGVNFMSTGSFVTGIVTGMAVGIGASMLMNPMDENAKKKLKKNTGQLFTAIGTVADNIIDMYK